MLAAGISGLVQGRPVLESDRSPAVGPDSPRGGSENLALDYADKGVRVVSARFAPTVHGVGDHGSMAHLVSAARRNGVAGYVGDGSHSWSAVHRTDAARLVRLGLENAPAGTKLHAVAEEALTLREIAETIGAALGLPVASVAPEDAAAHFGFVARFAGMGMSASGARTRDLLGWTPTGPTLAQDIAAGAYSAT